MTASRLDSHSILKNSILPAEGLRLDIAIPEKLNDMVWEDLTRARSCPKLLVRGAMSFAKPGLNRHRAVAELRPREC
jgi:hypothetical protein